MIAQVKVDKNYVLDLLMEDGVLLLPTKMGYALAGCTRNAIRKIYNIKGRPWTKPSGVAVSEKLFEKFCGSEHKSVAGQFPFPVGLIDRFNTDIEALNQASNMVKNGETMAFFVRLSDFIDDLADLCFEKGHVLMVTSANYAGEGNIFEYEDIPRDMLIRVNYTLPGDANFYKLNRSKFEKITNTILDINKGVIQRSGVFANRIAHQAYKMGLLKEEFDPMPINETPRSVFFLLTHKEKTFNKIHYFNEADWLVLDLQDSCPPDQKSHARKNIQDFLNSERKVKKPIYIRLNELSKKDELIRDLSIEFTEQISGFILPMLETAEDVIEFEKQIEAAEERSGLAKGHFKLIPLIECGEGIANVDSIAAQSDRSVAMIFGHADTFADTGTTRNHLSMDLVRNKVLWAARSNDLIAIDTPFTEIKNHEGLLEDANNGATAGLDAKVVLHVNQISVVNEIFGISKAEYLDLKDVTDSYDSGDGGIYYSKDKKLLAPPFVKKMKRDSQRKIHQSNKLVFNTITGKSLNNKGIELFEGKVISADFPVTIDSGWVNGWKSLSQNPSRIENDEEFAKSLGFKSRPVPYQALINFALCQLVNKFSVHCKFHLGVFNVKSIAPVYYDDTLDVSMCITKIKKTSKSGNYIVHSKINVYNQMHELVMQMDRKSLFEDFIKNEKCLSVHPAFEEQKKSETQLRIEANIQMLAYKESAMVMPLEESALILHQPVNKMDLSQSSIYCNLFRNAHPVHFNTKRYGEQGIAISGGLIVPVVCNIVSADYKNVMQEEILSTQHLNPVRDTDLIGAISLIHRIEKLGPNAERIHMISLGTRNLDCEKDLEKIQIPLDIFFQANLKPAELEDILINCCPILSRKLTVKVEWSVIRSI